MCPPMRTPPSSLWLPFLLQVCFPFFSEKQAPTRASSESHLCCHNFQPYAAVLLFHVDTHTRTSYHPTICRRVFAFTISILSTVAILTFIITMTTQLPSQNALPPLTKGGKRGPRGGVYDPFPIKLHRMLDEVRAAGLESVVSWLEHGRAFRIHQPKVFAATIMCRFFNQSKYTSFQRQLNLYGK